MQNNFLELLKYKAHIPCPKSLHLMGVVDEDGILEENEIFVQFCFNYPIIPLGAMALPGNLQNKSWFDPASYDRYPDGMEAICWRNIRTI